MTTDKRKQQIKKASATIRAGTQKKLDRILEMLEVLLDKKKDAN